MYPVALTEPHAIFRQLYFSKTVRKIPAHISLLCVIKKKKNFYKKDSPQLFYIQFRKILYLSQNRYNFVPYSLLLQLLCNVYAESNTKSPGFVYVLMISSISATGFCVGCSADFCVSFGNFQMDVGYRSVLS